VDRVIADLENNDPTAATAATNGGDGSGAMGPGLRVDRVQEGVSFAANLQSSEALAPDVRVETTTPDPHAEALRDEPSPAPSSPAPSSPPAHIDPAALPDPVSTTRVIPATEEGPAAKLDLSVPTDALVHITQVPATGEMRTAEGRLVIAGDTLSAAEAAGLRYLPPSDYDGSTPAGELVYTVSRDGSTIENGTARIELTAVNDAPMAQLGHATGMEDQTLPVSLHGADVDGPVMGVTVVSLPEGGRLWLADGTTPVTAGQTLTPAQAEHLLFQPPNDFHGDADIIYTVIDGAGQTSAPATWSLVFMAVNDAPVGGAEVVLTPINTAVTIDVLSHAHDVDGDALSVSAADLVDPALGSVSVNPDGTLHYTPTANTSGPVEIRYTVSDGQGGIATSVVTVQVGENSAPHGTDHTVSLDEDTNHALRVSDFGFVDTDAGQSLAQVRIDALPASGALWLDGSPVTAGQVVSVADVAAGRLVFTPEADAQGAGYASLAFSVQDSAGAYAALPNTLTFDVRALADAAVVSGQSSGDVVEDQVTTITGSLSVSDPDAGEAAFIAQADVPGSHGHFSIDPSGQWRYTLDDDDPAVQALASGDRLSPEVFTVTTLDGTTQQVAVTITGTNDAALLTPATAWLTQTDVVLSTGGALSISDVDSPATFVAQSGSAGSYGKFSIDPNGIWTYTADSAHQEFVAGTTYSDTFAVSAADGTTTTVTVYIVGTNDAAVLSTETVTLTETDAPLSTGGALSIADVDSPAAFVPQSATAGAYGTFSIDAHGAWTYTASSAHDEFAAGYTYTDTFTVSAADGTATTVTVHLIGTNDAAVLSTETVTLTETDAPLSTSGTLTLADVDSPATFVAQSGTAGSYGK
jgi:VCBS repeat-containing protein